MKTRLGMHYKTRAHFRGAEEREKEKKRRRR